MFSTWSISVEKSGLSDVEIKACCSLSGLNSTLTRAKAVTTGLELAQLWIAQDRVACLPPSRNFCTSPSIGAFVRPFATRWRRATQGHAPHVVNLDKSGKKFSRTGSDLGVYAEPTLNFVRMTVGVLEPARTR